MIDLQHYERILESGLMFDHYLVLCMVKNGEELPKNRRVQGFVNLLNKKGYIEDGAITDRGLLLVDISVTITGTPTEEAPEQPTDFMKWVINLHKKCQNRIMELTGGKQVRDKIKGKPYPFLPNSTDMAKSLHRAIKVYKIKDLDKIEKALIKHIEKCHAARSWFPLMKYYIVKGGLYDASSEMVTDLENIDEEETSSGKSNQKFV